MKHAIPRFLYVLTTLLLLLAVSLVPDSALAQCAVPANSTFPARITVCPSADIPVSGVVRDAMGNPCVGQVVTMSITSPCACNAPFSINSVSGPGGVVVFNPRSGGYCTAAALVTYTDIFGFILGTSSAMNSPDINGDCQVNLSDIALFSQSYFTGLNLARADYNWDGVLNLMDVTVMAMHIGH